MAKPRAVRRITAPVRERINRLAEILSLFLPLSSRSRNTTTFRTIFAESRVEHYLDGPASKQQALQQGLAELYRRHERLPWTIMRKAVPAAVEYRRYHRKPITRPELDALSSCLLELGIDMQSELASIELDESLPRITVAPDSLKERLRRHDLEPAISSEPLSLFEGGHFNEAVRKAAERFEDRVRAVSGRDAHGQALMGQAFSDASLLDLTALRPNNRSDFADGYKLMAMGLMAAVRNVFSHGDEERRSPEECFEMLMLLNWMFRALDEGDMKRHDNDE